MFIQCLARHAHRLQGSSQPTSIFLSVLGFNGSRCRHSGCQWPQRERCFVSYVFPSFLNDVHAGVTQTKRGSAGMRSDLIIVGRCFARHALRYLTADVHACVVKVGTGWILPNVSYIMHCIFPISVGLCVCNRLWSGWESTTGVHFAHVCSTTQQAFRVLCFETLVVVTRMRSQPYPASTHTTRWRNPLYSLRKFRESDQGESVE